MAEQSIITVDPWRHLRQVTQARIALGRAGGSLPTDAWLDFKSAHAAARDAVHNHFDATELVGEIASAGWPALAVSSAAPDRPTYLKRPDLGRRLDDDSRAALARTAASLAAPELAIVVSDGLSALAVHRQAAPLLSLLVPKLLAAEWRLAPVIVASYGRVALQDEVGELLGAELVLILLGERPGLGAADSLGAYLVYHPKLGNTDADRNCVSNIRPEGLPWAAAAETIYHLLSEARRRRLSGVHLKDERQLLRAGDAAAAIEDHRPPSA